MKLSKMILLILGSSLVWGCSLDERRVGASLGSGDEPQQMLTTEDAENLESTNRNIEIISSVDLTGYAENGSEEIIQLRNGRVIFQWYEDARSRLRTLCFYTGRTLVPMLGFRGDKVHTKRPRNR